LRASGRVVGGKRSEIDVEDGSDDGLAVELQKNLAGVSVLRKQARLANVRKIIVFFVRVIFQNGFGLRERGAGKKRYADPVVDDAGGDVDVVVVVEGVQLFEIVFAAAQLRVDFVTARIGEAVHIKEVAGEQIGVHARFGFFPVMVEGGEGFWLRLVGAGERSKKGNGGSEQGCDERARDGWLHERSVLNGWRRMLDEGGEVEVRVKEQPSSISELLVCKGEVSLRKGDVRICHSDLVGARDESSAPTPGVSASSVHKRLKNKEIAKLRDPSVRKRIEVKGLAHFLGGGHENGGTPEGFQETAR